MLAVAVYLQSVTTKNIFVSEGSSLRRCVSIDFSCDIFSSLCSTQLSNSHRILMRILRAVNYRVSGRHTAIRDIEMVDLGEKPGCLEFLTMARLDGTPVFTLLMQQYHQKSSLQFEFQFFNRNSRSSYNFQTSSEWRVKTKL